MILVGVSYSYKHLRQLHTLTDSPSAEFGSILCAFRPQVFIVDGDKYPVNHKL